MTGNAGRAHRLWAALLAPLLVVCAGAQEFKAPVPGVPSLSLPVQPAAAALPSSAQSLPAAPAAALPRLDPAAASPAPLPQAAALPPAASGGAGSPAAASAESRSAALDGIFDGRRPSDDSNAPAVPVPAPAGPRLPPGFERVTAHTVRTEDDVRKLVPLGYSPNSETLTRKLERNVAKMQPYEVYTYFDRRGGKVIGIDLSRKPELVDVLPEQQSHEVRLIKKIQAWNLDLQVVVREEGATPDLIVGGVFTELKSRMGSGKSFSQLLDKANGQVSSHARRHGSGPGAVIIDLVGRRAGLPMSDVAAELDSWRRSMAAAGRPVALKKIYVFAGKELNEFDRQPDGSYAPAAAVTMPFAPGGRTVRPALTPPPPRTTMADAFARNRVEKTVRHLMKKGRYRAVLAVWEDFTLIAGPEEAARVRRRLGTLLESAKAKLDNPKPRTVRRRR